VTGSGLTLTWGTFPTSAYRNREQ